MVLTWILFIGTVLISAAAVAHVRSSYARFSRMRASSGLTGAEAAAQILQLAGVHDVEIVPGAGVLTDHYDPVRRRLVLSEANYYGRSVAALGVAAHEAGHAIQHAQAYAPLQIRMAAVGLTNFASQLVLWLPLFGIATGLLSTYTGLGLMAIGWGIIMTFNLVTLPVEIDASRRARQLLVAHGLVDYGLEAQAVGKVLNAAAWTYVAAFLTSVAYFLLYLLPLLSGGRRSRF